MKALTSLSKEELANELEVLKKEYDELVSMNLALDMSRGKPEPGQLDLALDMLDVLDKDTDFVDGGLDARNYGGLDGLASAKNLFADMLKTTADHVLVGGASSLNMMFDAISRAYMFGLMGETPWCKLDKVKFLCPSPGYDRHFAVTEHFGFENILVPMKADGPDMDVVEELVKDPAVKGIWCVPKYSNPEGVVYSDEVVKRFANLKPAAKDFRIFWDNAYMVHHLYEKIEILNIIDECEKAGNPDMYYEFCSFSKISFAGAGIAAMAVSPANLAEAKKTLTIQTIGSDKVNMLRHVLYFKDAAGVDAHMEKHAAMLRPKFEMVDRVLTEGLDGLDAGTWTKPKGGYFVTFYTKEGCAKRVIELCKNAGVVMTGAGAPFPYKKDPQDSVIRISPSYPTIDELEKAVKVFVTCVKLATVENLM